MSLLSRMVKKLVHDNLAEIEQARTPKVQNTKHTTVSDNKSEDFKSPSPPSNYNDQQRSLFNKLPYDLQKVVVDTQHSFIRINTRVCETMRLTDSKFGGVPYIPEDGNYPMSTNGNPLMLLAQINFDQVFEQINHAEFIELPKQGLLQIFINAADENLGLEGNNLPNDDSYHIRFLPTIDIVADTLGEATKLARDSIDTQVLGTVFSPISIPLKLSFSKADGCAGVSENLLEFIEANQGQAIDEIDYENSEKEDLAYEIMNKLSNAGGHKLLGMPIFPNKEFRKPYSNLPLLLQIDSEYPLTDDYQIMWGDMGTANFFIKPESLIRRNFDQLTYHWDCE